MSNLQVEANQSTNNIPITLTPKQQPTLLLTPDKVWGTKDYENLENKPSLNGRELTKGMTLADFNLHPDKVEKNEEDIININEYLKELTPKNVAEGESSLYIKDALELPIFEMSIEGNSYQQQTTGKQLYNYKDTTQVTDGITVDEDGWATVAYDNTSGTEGKYFNYWTNNLNLKPSTDYLIVLEVKNVQGTGGIKPMSVQTVNGVHTQGQFRELNTNYYFTDLSNNTIEISKRTTVENPMEVLNGLRTYLFFSAGHNGSITFRLSVLEDTSVTPETFIYEPYSGEIPGPNPNYPQEIEVLKGYNLFDKNELVQGNISVSTGEEISSNYAVRTPYIDVSSSSMYTISGSLYTGAGTFNISILQFASDNTFIEGTQYANKSFPNFTTNKNTSKIRVTIYSDSGTKPTNFNELFPDFQLVKGVTKIYLPYQNIGYGSVGKNFLNVSSEYMLTGSETHKINIPAGSYIISWGDIITTGTEKNMLMYFYYEDGTTLARYISPTYTSKTLNLTATKNINKVNIYSQSGYNTSQNVTTTFKNLMISIEGGEYKSYKEPIIVPIDLKGNFVSKLPNGVADNLLYKDKHIYLKKNVGKVVFDGSENWSNNGTIDTNIRRMIVDTIVDGVLKPSSSADVLHICCNYYKTYSALDTYNLIEGISVASNGYINIYDSAYNTTDVSLYKTWLSEHNLEVYYPLATPELIDLGEYDLSTLQSTNNITLLANLEPSEMNLTYALDLKKYYDNKIAELSNQLL